jgi:hypothetical protein
MDEPKLPPLPITDWVGLVHRAIPYEPEWTSDQNGYDEEQMTTYATEAERLGYLRGLEEAAKVCECKGFGRDSAAAIRALAQKEQK